MVDSVAPGPKPGLLMLIGRCCEGTLRPDDRFVRIDVVEVDEALGSSTSEQLAQTDLVVVELFAYGKVRKQLDVGMTGRVTVRHGGGEPPDTD